MHLRLYFMTLSLAAGFLTAGCQSVPSSRAKTDIRAVLEAQVREWNQGNLAGFMEIYARSEQTRFASGGDVTLGWQPVFDRYQKRYGTGAGMGTLTFSNVQITSLAPDAAYAFGRWHLKRGTNEPSGLFTLIFEKTPAGWRIVHDHTSAKP